MLTLALVALAITGSFARIFNITDLIIPGTVPADQEEVEIECRYDANFTLLNWFKGPNEFFRYEPGTTPSTHSFPVLGVGKIDMISCGPTSCRLRLGSLTEEASGLYRCDIEHDAPPFKFATKSAYMYIHGHQYRKPLIEGLAKEYGDGEEMKAYCRGAPDAELRWYVNGHEMVDIRGSATLKRKSSKFIFLGIPPTVTVQCAEFRYGNLSGSKEMKARWKEYVYKENKPQEQRNSSSNLNCFGLVSVVCVVSSIFFI